MMKTRLIMAMAAVLISIGSMAQTNDPMVVSTAAIAIISLVFIISPV